MFDAERAERLKHNEDFQAFVKRLENDAEIIKETIINSERDAIEPSDMALMKVVRLIERVKTIRLIIATPDQVIENAK